MSREQIAGVLSEVLADYGEGLSGCAFDEIVDRLSQPQAASSTQAGNPWRDAVTDACVVACIDWDENDPRGSLERLIAWREAIALDPRVSGKAAALAASSTTPGREDE